MKIKVCGTREPDNIKALSALDIDMLGLIFYKKSKRFVTNKEAKQILPILTESPQSKVGVFVNSEFDTVLNAVHDFELDYIQLHGTESPEYCFTLQSIWRSSSARSAKIIKAFSVDETFDFQLTNAYTPYCNLFLFDTKGKDYGGNGVQFDWSLLDKYHGLTPFLLSGGIDENSIEAILNINHPQFDGIDINSKFESKPALKDVDKIQSFIHNLKAKQL